MDGLVELPPGKIAAIATYLEMERSARPAPSAWPVGLALEPLAGDLARYRAIYGEVGRPWLWFSRVAMRDRKLAAILDDPAVEPLALTRDGRDIGILELDFRTRPDCELAFLGLVPGLHGQGLGRRLLAEAIARAFSRPIERLWLHTCTLDHPAALRLYLAAGFRPYRRAIEIADDPRLAGLLPRDAGAGYPIVA